MKERAFNARTDDVRAILAGATVLRRLVRPPRGEGWRPVGKMIRTKADLSDPAFRWDRAGAFGATQWVEDRCPYGQPGGRLWIRETWAPVPTPGGYGCAPDACEREAMLIYRTDGARPDLRRWSDGSPRWDGRWRSASAMPRWASRLVLEVVGVEVEKSPQGWAWVVTFRRADG